MEGEVVEGMMGKREFTTGLKRGLAAHAISGSLGIMLRWDIRDFCRTDARD